MSIFVNRSTLVAIHNQSKEIVSISCDGKVNWNNGIKIDEAAEAFSQCLRLGTEISAGINKRVKSEIAESIYNSLIDFAKNKGPLTSEDLTFMLNSYKIMGKLDGTL